MADCTTYSSYVDAGSTTCDYVNADSMVVTSHLNNDGTAKVFAKTESYGNDENN